MPKSFSVLEFYINDLNFPINKPPRANKYDYGRLLVQGGDNPYSGALLLSIMTAIKTGIGIGYVLTSNKNSLAILKDYPEVICLTELTQLKKIITDNIVIVSGPGTSDIDVHDSFLNLLTNHKNTSVLDASMIQSIKYKKFLHPPIITPHEGEASKLLEIPSKKITNNRSKIAIQISQKFNCITVLKGSNTIICDGKDIYKCMHGSTNLAKAGTGDVLAGLIGSFLSQGLNPINSCKTAVGLHGYCGDLFKDRNFSAYELVNKIAQERFSLSPHN